MSLVSILLFAVSALAVLSGVSALLGASKADRVRLGWFFTAAIFAALWTIAIAVFLSLPVEAENVAPVMIIGIYLCSALMMVALLGFASWNTVPGKILTVAAALSVAITATLVVSDSKLLFDGFVLSNRGNSVNLVNGPIYWLYIFFFLLNSGLAWLFILRHSKKARSKRVRQGDMVLLVGLIFTGIAAFTSDLFLPLFVRYDLIWIGPFTLSITLVAFYYAILKFGLFRSRRLG